VEKFVPRAGFEEEFLVRGQAGGVSQQHAEGDFVAAWVFGFGGEEFGNYCGDGRVEVQEATLVEEHGGGSGCDHFCERGQVEEGGGGDVAFPTSRKIGEKCGTRVFLIGIDKAAEGFEGDYAVLMRDCY
jgi:hypothetical protein